MDPSWWASVPPPRVLADEMVGSLARYLRFMGCDTTYAHGWSDDEIVQRARVEDRIVVTRDRRLSQRAPKSLLLSSTHLEGQVREVWAAFPDLTPAVRFERCTLCNGTLSRIEPRELASRDDGIPWERVAVGLPLYRCEACGHLYWEGSHTAGVRRRLSAWSEKKVG
jgi:uncharacterized protein with PIN domain